MYDHMADTRFLEAMAALGEAVSQDLSDPKLKIYAHALEDYPVADIEQACWYIIRHRTTATFPKVAEIIEAISGKPQDQAVLALTKLDQAIRWHGGYYSVIFDDPLIHVVVDAMGGWIRLCDLSHTDEWIWTRKEFQRLYEAVSAQGAAREPSPVLIGRIQADNEPKGYRYPKAVIMGDKRKALAWQAERINQLTGEQRAIA